jgi:cell volume regulation protein A
LPGAGSACSPHRLWWLAASPAWLGIQHLELGDPGQHVTGRVARAGTAGRADWYHRSRALGAGGFLAVYVCSLVLGNARLPHGPTVRGFAEGVAWLAQIGLLASPARLPAQILPALGGSGVTSGETRR